MVFVPEEHTMSMFHKTFSLFDLIFLGVGSTLGVGIYIISGHVAKDIAGPAIILSFLLAAVISILAGLCFAELGACSPAAGSVYSYCYVTLGEFMAFCMGWNLLTEYIIGAASVVKALSVYIDSFLNHTFENNLRELYEIDIPYLSQYFDVLAFAICLGFSVILSFGLKESVLINNILTGVNILMVLFFIIIGLTKVNKIGTNPTLIPNFPPLLTIVDLSNWNIPLTEIPAKVEAGKGGFLPYGWKGVIEGAGICFYGFLGFDAIATTGAEVKTPETTLPTSIIVSLGIVFFAYFGISTVLTLIVPYYIQDQVAPLSFACQYLGYDWAKWIINIGSIFGLMATLFGSFYPISRILFAMANDGLILRSLAKIDSTYRTPIRGTLVSGVITGITAALLDVDHLISLNSLGTLLSYTVVAICVIVLRYSVYCTKQAIGESESLLFKSDKKCYDSETDFQNEVVSGIKANFSVSWSIGLFSIFSILLSVILTYDLGLPHVTFFTLVIVVMMFSLILVIKSQSMRINVHFAPFQMPMVPYLPAISIFLNIYLMMQFNLYTWIRFIFWIFIGFLIYFSYGIFHTTKGGLHRIK